MRENVERKFADDLCREGQGARERKQQSHPDQFITKWARVLRMYLIETEEAVK
jgi:hypothetical protein